jgi:hypothetical protein
MPVNQGPFFWRERALFFQNGVGHPNLANVVQQGGDFHLIHVLFAIFNFEPLGSPTPQAECYACPY